MMKRFLIFLLFILASPGFARSGNQEYSYISVGVPYGKLTSESDTVNELDAASGLSFNYGKRFGKYFALEFTYSDMSFAENADGIPGFPADFTSDLKLTEMMLGYQIFLTKYWAIKMGYNHATFKRVFSDSGLTSAQSEVIAYDKTFHTFYFGMVANVRLIGNIGMYFEALYTSTDAYNKTSAGAGLQIRF